MKLIVKNGNENSEIIEKKIFTENMLRALNKFVESLPKISPESENWCFYMSRKIENFKREQRHG